MNKKIVAASVSEAAADVFFEKNYQQLLIIARRSTTDTDSATALLHDVYVDVRRNWQGIDEPVKYVTAAFTRRAARYSKRSATLKLVPYQAALARSARCCGTMPCMAT